MKLALVYPFLRRPGGIERYVAELGRVLAADGQEVVLVNGDAPAGEAERDRSTPTHLRIPFLPRPVALATATFSVASTLALRSRRFDVINVHGASGLRADVVTAHSCHKAWFLASLAALPRFGPRWWLKALNPVHWVTIAVETLQYRNGRIIAVAPSVRDELVERYGIDPARITVVPSGVDCEAFHPRNRARHRRRVIAGHGLAPEHRVLLFVGNEFRRKGLETVLEAMALLDDPETRLLVVGRDRPEPYRGLARRLGVADRVVFVGSVPDPSPYYAAADVFVLPTRYEAFGLVLLEAMASGLPLVTSGLAGAAELVEDGRSGLLLPDPGDAEALADRLRRLADPELRRSMGASARRRAEGFSWERVAERTLDVFRAGAAS